ncbi:MAG TPA: hypothetical protein P5244_04325 [Syntrophales bacterium]|nr:hypothetical protein [Syntrophales bacterium]
MDISVKLISYSVLKDNISVQLVCDEGKDDDPTLPLQLTSLQGQHRYIHIGELETKGMIKSVAIRKGIHILLHLPCTQYVAKKLFYMMESGKQVRLIPVSESEGKLNELLEKAAKMTDKAPNELLKELTTFTNKSGKLIEGRESAGELSPRHQEVVIYRLNQMLHGDNA